MNIFKRKYLRSEFDFLSKRIEFNNSTLSSLTKETDQMIDDNEKPEIVLSKLKECHTLMDSIKKDQERIKKVFDKLHPNNNNI